MHAFFLFLPTLLMVHNAIDFGQSGADRSYVNILNCAVTDYVETLEEYNNLRLVNKGGIFDKKVRRLKLHFVSYDFYSLSTARTLMIGLVDNLLEALNRSQRLRPYRPNPCEPFNLNNIEISVDFVDPSLHPYPSFEQIKYAIFSEGIITYYVAGVNPCSGSGELTRYREEPFGYAKRASPPPYIPPGCRSLPLTP